jgi:putative protease
MTDVKSGYAVEISADHVIEQARKVATDADRIMDSLSRLGDTPFTPGLTGIDIQIDDDIMVPVSIVNKMRREAADKLIDERRNGVMNGRNPLGRAKLDVIESGELLGAACLDTDSVRERIASGKIRPVALENFMAGERKGRLPYILNVSKGNLDAYIRENFDAIADAVRDTGILIGNLGWIERFRDAGIKVYGDYGLNIYNEQARLAYEEAGVEMYMPSHETGIRDERGIPLMVTEHPVDADVLTDRKGGRHRIVTAPCRDKTLIF